MEMQSYVGMQSTSNSQPWGKKSPHIRYGSTTIEIDSLGRKIGTRHKDSLDVPKPHKHSMTNSQLQREVERQAKKDARTKIKM